MKIKAVSQLHGGVLIALPLVVMLALLLMIACDDDDGGVTPTGNEITGGVVDFSECGGFRLSITELESAIDSSCVVYEYTNNTLNITHRSSLFNCCVERLTAVVAAANNVITITESETAPIPCDCLCPYDLVMEINNLPPGEYSVIVNTPYFRDPIQFDVNLANQPSGHFCYDECYPPPIDSSWGVLTGLHGCGIPDDGVEVPDSLEFRHLITWEYDDDNVLTLGHHNSLANCCADDFKVLLSVTGNTITIIEIDSTVDLCYCICAIGLDMEIHNLPPGEYDVTLFLPGDLWFNINFAMDLVAEPSGYYVPGAFIEVSEP